MARKLRERLALFIRDYVSEFGCAWSIARYRRCDRNGGHRWKEPKIDPHFGLSRVCGRCGTLEQIPETQGTAASTLYVTTATTNTNPYWRPTA